MKVLRAEIDFIALDENGEKMEIAEYVLKNNKSKDMTEKEYKEFAVQDDDFSEMTEDEFKDFIIRNKTTIAERACLYSEYISSECIDFVSVTDVSFEYVDID